MNILYYTWNELSAHDLYTSLSSMGHTVNQISFPLTDYTNDEKFMAYFTKVLSRSAYDAIITFDFFPIISNIAQERSLPYISWVYDCPHSTLYSDAIKNKSTFIFAFDAGQYGMLCANGCENAFHLPLAVHTKRLLEQLGSSPWLQGFQYDVSFLGSLYENNFFRKINYLPEFLSGYLEGLLSSQHLLYGENFIEDLLTDTILDELLQYIRFDLSGNFHLTSKDLLSEMLNKELTCRDRITFLNALASQFSLTLFTSSDPALVPGSRQGGFIDYITKMPLAFAGSRINLNFTLRSITSGIPLRALDIMGAGGFLLSNYQPELAEYFIDGEECAMFSSKEELLDKTAYYLRNEQKRLIITQKGWEKTNRCFSYPIQLQKIFDAVNI